MIFWTQMTLPNAFISLTSRAVGAVNSCDRGRKLCSQTIKLHHALARSSVKHTSRSKHTCLDTADLRRRHVYRAQERRSRVQSSWSRALAAREKGIRMRSENGQRLPQEQSPESEVRGRRAAARRVVDTRATASPRSETRSEDRSLAASGEDDRALMPIERHVPTGGSSARSKWYWCAAAVVALGASAGVYAFGHLPSARDLQSAQRTNANQLEERASETARREGALERTQDELQTLKATEAARPEEPASPAEPVMIAEAPTEQSSADSAEPSVTEPADEQAARDERRRARAARVAAKRAASKAHTASKSPRTAAATQKAKSKKAHEADRAKTIVRKGALTGVLSDSNDPLMGL